MNLTQKKTAFLSNIAMTSKNYTVLSDFVAFALVHNQDSIVIVF